MGKQRIVGMSSGPEPTSQVVSSKDFFLSYTSKDKAWAEWIAWQLEAEGYGVFLQEWDFRPGDNFMRLMDGAIRTYKRTLAVLSPDYLDPNAAYSYQEMLATLVQDPTGQGKNCCQYEYANAVHKDCSRQ
jgi:hypothetical protein